LIVGEIDLKFSAPVLGQRRLCFQIEPAQEQVVGAIGARRIGIDAQILNLNAAPKLNERIAVFVHDDTRRACNVR
jgi:hypothetical protein